MKLLHVAILSLIPTISNAGGVPLNQSIFNALDGKGLHFQCFGTEPFWSLSFAKNPSNTVTLTEPGITGAPLPFTYAEQNSGGQVRSVFSNSAGLSGSVTYEPAMNCSDGMSDFNYSFSVSVTFPASMSAPLSGLSPLQGCCQLRAN